MPISVQRCRRQGTALPIAFESGRFSSMPGIASSFRREPTGSKTDDDAGDGGRSRRPAQVLDQSQLRVP